MSFIVKPLPTVPLTIAFKYVKMCVCVWGGRESYTLSTQMEVIKKWESSRPLQLLIF